MPKLTNPVASMPPPPPKGAEQLLILLKKGGPMCEEGCLFPIPRTKDKKQIIAVNGTSTFTDNQDFQFNEELAGKRLSPDEIKGNGKYFQMPISTGTMNFIRTGPKPSADDVTILVLPGCPDQNFTHFPLVKDFAGKVDVVALEIPSRGWGTDKNKSKNPYTMDGSAYAIKAAIRQLGLKKVIIVAHSFGQAEAMHAIAANGPQNLGVIGVVSLNGWNPQLVAEELPYDMMEKLASNRLSAGFSWFAAKKLPKSIAGGTWKKMVNEKDKSKELDQATAEWSKVFKGNKGYTISEAYNTVRQERLVSLQVEQYQKNLQPYQENLRTIPILFIGTTEDTVVLGPQDKNGAAYAQKAYAAVKKLGNTNPLTQVISPKGEHCFHFAHPKDASTPILAWVEKVVAAK